MAYINYLLSICIGVIVFNDKGVEYLRKTTIVMALLDAKDRGLLGEGYDGKDMNIY